MNTKHITALVTFVAAFTVSVGIMGLVNFFHVPTGAENITRLISQDVRNYTNARHYNTSDIGILASEVAEYVDASDSIDTEGVPEDFVNAWQIHLKAWRQHSEKLARISAQIDDSDGDFERLYDLRAEFRRAETEDTAQINQSWYNAIRIARAHGAAIPRKALDLYLKN